MRFEHPAIEIDRRGPQKPHQRLPRRRRFLLWPDRAGEVQFTVEGADDLDYVTGRAHGNPIQHKTAEPAFIGFCRKSRNEALWTAFSAPDNGRASLAPHSGRKIALPE